MISDPKTAENIPSDLIRLAPRAGIVATISDSTYRSRTTAISLPFERYSNDSKGMKRYIPILTIAGSDSSGGAGIQADIKTISAIGCYAMSAITAITAQNTTGVRSIQGIKPEIVTDQIDMVFSDIPPMATKTGMLFDKANVEAVSESLARHRVKNLVVDPVMVSTSGSLLIERDAINTMIDRLFPLATLITPNKDEAIELTGTDKPVEQARILHSMGCRNVLLKGGDSDRADMKIDYLSIDGDDELITLTADAVNTPNTHGTGCTISAAIATYLALDFDIIDATMRGKLFITRALQAGARVSSGRGHGPVNHLFSPRHMKYANYKRSEHENQNQ